MVHLALTLLGPFQASLDGKPAKGLNSDYLRALLAYLAVESKREHPREQVASLLWPERSDQEAHNSLRFALSKLHSALGDRRAESPFLIVSRTHVQFNLASDHWLDVTEFERSAASDPPGAGGGQKAEIERMITAVELYRGPFLEGLSIADSPAFEEWMLLKGEEIHRSLLAMLDRLTVFQMRAGETGEAARWARKQLELEPYREQAHRQLMRALALGGERSAALAHYETCRCLLAGELGCEPEDETQALYAQIRNGVLTPIQPSPLTLAESHQPGLPTAETGRAGALSAGAAPVAAFVSRQGELARLDGLLENALAGQGGVALVSGEAGSGKTALLNEFSQQAGLAYPDLIALRGRCSAHGGAGDPYLPFREILQTLAGDVESKRAGGTLSPEQARRVWEALPAVGAALAEHGPDLIDRFVPGEALLQRLESFSTPGTAARWWKRLRELGARSAGSASTSQPDLFAQATQVLHVLSLRFPLILAVDDLQWADGVTLALLFHLGRRLDGSRILLVCAYRPEALQEPPDPKGLGRPLGSVLQELTREWGDILVDLDRADGQAFVEAYVDSEPNRLGAGFRQALYGHTEGNPLFTVELLRSFERQGALVREEAGQWIEAPGLDWKHVPARVEAVIAGHLAGLSDEDRALLGTASVQGDNFTAEVAAQVLGWDEQAALRRLSGPLRTRHRLVEAVSLDRLPSSGQRLSNYRFRHLLVQRSAYAGLDQVERARLHEATGRALEAIYSEGERPTELAAELARHYEAAGLALEAARALHEAGRQAMRLTALREALDRFDHGLALLADVPPSPEREELERLLQVDRLGPQAAVGGTGSSQLAGDLARAAGAGAGEAHGRPKLLMLEAEANLLNARGQFEECLAAAGQMLEEATRWGDEAFVVDAYFWFGHVYHLMGKLQEADRRFESAVARLTPELGADLRAAAGFDLAPQTLIFSALNRWMLGYPERALARSTQALAGAVEQQDPYGRAFACAIGSMILFLLHSDPAALQARAEPGYRLCLQQGIAWWQDYSEVFLGWLAVMRGDPGGDAGIGRMQNAIAAWQAKGMVVGTDGLLVVLADGCLAAARRRPAGDHAEHARLLGIGVAAIEPFLGPDVPCGQSFQAELLRLRGELLLARDGLAAAEEALACFQQALQLGRDKGALAWELRAAMSLVRLRMRQGKAYATELAEARACLREVYARFTEGFEFPDLQEAAILIGEAG